MKRAFGKGLNRDSLPVHRSVCKRAERWSAVLAPRARVAACPSLIAPTSNSTLLAHCPTQMPRLSGRQRAIRSTHASATAAQRFDRSVTLPREQSTNVRTHLRLRSLSGLSNAPTALFLKFQTLFLNSSMPSPLQAVPRARGVNER
jgi:hypothetical protein